MFQPDPSWSAEVAAALADAPVFDGHNDLVLVLREERGSSVAGLDVEATAPQTDIPRLRRGGVGAQFWSAWVPPTFADGEAVHATIEQIDAIHRFVAAYPDHLAFARTAADVRVAWKSGKIASLIGVEGGHSIGRSAAAIRAFADLGMRYLTLTHTSNTAWADSGTDTPQADGLTDEGRAVIVQLNELGVLVDLSHTSEATQRDGLAATRAPAIFSHSSARAVTDHPRNVSDDVLRLLAAGGGVACVTFVPFFISAAVADWLTECESWMAARGVEPGSFGAWAPAPRPGETAEETMARCRAERGDVSGQPDAAALEEEWSRAHPMPAVGVLDVVRHVEHVREVAGIDHVGLGGDYDGVWFQPEGLRDVSGYPRLLAALADRGWSRSDLAALSGRNMLRVLQDAEDAAGPKTT
ncbi:MAG: dipeptidase [Bifidobacteriaceae bacterium]|jgi:membrane dipeptidase|nr:dipeptidase [Bifidobacteriaceae bacterium]